MVLGWATIPSRALMWHLEKQLLCFMLEKYSHNEMFMFETRYGFYTSCFYVMKGVGYFKKSLSILMFSHIFLLHNKIFSEADATQIPAHPIRLKQLCFLAPAKTMTPQLRTTAGRQAPRTPFSHNQVLLTLGLWAQGWSNRSLPHCLGRCTLETQGGVFIVFSKLKSHICNTKCREKPKQLSCLLPAFNLLEGGTSSSSWF